MDRFGGAAVAALAIAVLNAIVPPIVAALRIPFMALLGFLVVLLVDAAMLMLVSDIAPHTIEVDNFGWALATALVAAAVGVVLDIVFGTNDDDTYTLRVTQRLARRGKAVKTDVPGLLFLEIDGLALPVLRRAMRDGSAPTMASWLAEGSHRLIEWEPDLSSQTGASQTGILLGSNEDIPAFRWVDKPTGRVIACSGPADCQEIEARLASGIGLLVNGGASRGNLFSGEADELILTCSRISAEKHANPGYRAFFANGFNVTRTLVLFGWEIVLEVTASARAARRNVRPRGHRGGMYPLLRAAICVVVRDLIVYSVLADMMFGRPVVYATLSSYDEVAHHSGLERPDTLEALRKLDQQIGRVEQACRYAARPYHVVVLSDHGQTQGATFKQRNGYSLEELVGRSLESGTATAVGGGDEQNAMASLALGEATGRTAKRRKEEGKDVSDRQAVVLGSGNLGLVYLMEEKRRLTLEEIDARHPRLIQSLREHPHIGWLLVRSERARAGRARRPRHALPRGRAGRGRGPARALLADRARAPPAHGRLRARRRHHGRELLRPRSRRGLRLRGADLLPRRARRPADAPVHPLPRRAPLTGGADRRRRRRARRPHRLAPAPPALVLVDARGEIVAATDMAGAARNRRPQGTPVGITQASGGSATADPAATSRKEGARGGTRGSPTKRSATRARRAAGRGPARAAAPRPDAPARSPARRACRRTGAARRRSSRSSRRARRRRSSRSGRRAG